MLWNVWSAFRKIALAITAIIAGAVGGCWSVSAPGIAVRGEGRELPGRLSE